jgi:branched-subunit amino acid transport protein
MSAWPYLLIGTIATYFWRASGVALSGRINADSALMRWVAAVAYAMLAGLIARLIVEPQGTLGTTALWMRLSAAALAVVVYFLGRRSVVLGVAAGTLWLILATSFATKI